MSSKGRRSAQTLLWVFAGLCLIGVVGVMISSTLQRGSSAPASAGVGTPQSLQLMPGKANTLQLSDELINTLGVRTVQVQSAAPHDALNLSGLLDVDPNRMVRVHSRFAGEVVSIGGNLLGEPGAKPAESRLLRPGDRVTRGQLLAVVWSKDVGEKKSDLVNALSMKYLDETQLNSLQQLGKDVIAERQLREASQKYEADIIEVDRLERTLRSWRLSEAEITVVRAEAKKIHAGDVEADMAVDKSWAEVEVRSPFDGTVMEKNIVAGDIVDTNLDLFKIADLSVLSVRANIYEEDLPALEALRPQERHWTISLKSQIDTAGIPATFDLIGNIVDPNQHTAAVFGWLDNKDGRLRAGQFITATVELPAVVGEVVIPDTALIEEGTQCVVFVASDVSGKEVARRRVALASRGQDVAFVRSQPTAEEEAQGCQPLRPGEWVVAEGGILLDGALDSALATAPSERESVEN
ncbi:MAG: efflux RND transporter periplasmic adaptor subunit [Planctomycetia bacterium]|nr:efflux RND transporter periplasmic adaptor subunit [Planctomycetia bacterium]